MYDENTQQSGSTGSILQHNKGHIQKTYSQHHTQRLKLKTFPLDQDQDKDIHFHDFYAT